MENQVKTAKDRPPFSAHEIAWARKHPQARAHGLPAPEQMIAANVQWHKKKTEAKNVALLSYLRAQEKSQTEVVAEFDRFMERCLAAVLGSDPLLKIEDLELAFGELQKNFEQDFVIEVRGVPAMLVSRRVAEKWVGDKKLYDWEFSAKVLGED